MPALQEQDEDRAGAYSVCCQAALPRAGSYEYRFTHVHRPIWRVNQVKAADLAVEVRIRAAHR